MLLEPPHLLTQQKTLSEFFSWLIVFLQTYCAVLAVNLWAKSDGLEKNKYRWLALSFIMLMIDQIAFMQVVYADSITIGNISTSKFLIYCIPFFLWLLFQTLFLLTILFSYIEDKKAAKRKFLAISLINIPVLSLFLLSFTYTKTDGIVFFASALIVVYKLFLFALLLVCLLYSKNISLKSMFTGVILITASGTFLNYAALSHTNNLLAYAEAAWLLGDLLITFGLFLLLRNRIPLTKIFRQKIRIRSQIAFWMFAYSLAGFLVLIAIFYFTGLLRSEVLSLMPFIAMVYSVVAITASIVMGKCFEQPFKQILTDIKLFSFSDEKLQTRRFETEEFSTLHNFLLDAIETRTQKEQAERNLNKIAAQVAHDIQSPLASLTMLAQSCPEIPEYKRIALRSVASSIENIADQLLRQYKANSPSPLESDEPKTQALLSALLMRILVDKKFQYQQTQVDIQLKVEPSCMFVCAYIQPSSFSRMISNLINNAVEACGQTSKPNQTVVISLKSDDTMLTIKLIDTGCGMSSEQVEKISNAIAFSHGKNNGHGIGLTQVREALTANQGKMSICSEVGIGTEITLSFPLCAPPFWLGTEIALQQNDILLILDDDPSIHQALDIRFNPLKTEYPELRILHFTHAHEVLSFIRTLNDHDRAHVFLFSDYELLGQPMNGLDVIEKTLPIRALLVTSHYENPDIQARSQQLGIRIIPKQLIAEAPVSVATATDIQEEKSADLILVEDDEMLAFSLCLSIGAEFDIKHYTSPESCLEEIGFFNRKIKICIDQNYENSSMKGITLAGILFSRGFKNLFLVTGENIQQHEVPSYLTVVAKRDLHSIIK